MRTAAVTKRNRPSAVLICPEPGAESALLAGAPSPARYPAGCRVPAGGRSILAVLGTARGAALHLMAQEHHDRGDHDSCHKERRRQRSQVVHRSRAPFRRSSSLAAWHGAPAAWYTAPAARCGAARRGRGAGSGRKLRESRRAAVCQAESHHSPLPGSSGPERWRRSLNAAEPDLPASRTGTFPGGAENAGQSLITPGSAQRGGAATVLRRPAAAPRPGQPRV